MKIFHKIIVAKRWVDALDASAHDNYQNALAHLDYVDKSYNGIRISYHLLRGFVCFALKKDSEAVENCKTSIELLERADHYNKDEKDYILGYATTLGNKALAAAGATKNTKLFPQVDIASIILSNVHRSLKSNFPLRNHPNWVEKMI